MVSEDAKGKALSLTNLSMDHQRPLVRRTKIQSFLSLFVSTLRAKGLVVYVLTGMLAFRPCRGYCCALLLLVCEMYNAMSDMSEWFQVCVRGDDESSGLA
ncbi:hypothetical protein PMIN03_006727 [Paraphaeosphaeria minitans]